VRRVVGREGVGGTARLIAIRLRRLVYLREQHIWYLLLLGAVEQLPLAAGYELRLATEADLAMLATLSGMRAETAAKRRSDGAQLWLLVHGREAAFCCWIFPRQTPMRAAVGGMLELPAGVACLEDSFTGAEHRGRGLAGAAWTRIAARAGGDGFKALITKVEVTNVPSRKAVEKAGFVNAGTMELLRRGRSERVTLHRPDTPLDPPQEAVATQLAHALER
jgi:L-amino acid N-acyltransferase YncA